jgi:hypothetical protein
MTREPYNIEAERAANCAMLRDHSCIEDVASIIGPGDFSKAHAPIVLRTFELWQSGNIPDLVTVTNSLKEHGELEAVGGPAYLASLLDMGVLGSNAKAYAQLIRKSADDRRIIAELQNTLEEANSNGNDPLASVDKLAGKVHRIRAASDDTPNRFERLAEDRYSLSVLQSGIVIEADRLRREHGELIGELAVRCKLPGIRTYDGNLSIADFNFSSARARSERARLLADRSGTKEIDWPGILEELCQRTLAEERNGRPAVDLRELDRPAPDDSMKVEGVVLPRRHPGIIFGDGGAAKSYTGLYLSGRLAEQGLNVALFDWELAGEDHRDRLERLFGIAMPRISYARCERALVYEADRLRRIVRDEKIDYAVFDSVAFACDGPPESAEVAGRYFRAVRQINIGSLHIAHITKSEGGDTKPFGSVFWHNGARSTWFAKLADASQDGKILHLGLFNKKSNLGQLLQPTGFKIAFTQDRTYFSRTDPADNPDLAEKMSIRQRIVHLLRDGSMPLDTLASELDSNPDTVRRTVRRHKEIFTVLEGGQVALLQRIA